jgi:L-threonylcarbamoyladenylate synthase
MAIVAIKQDNYWDIINCATKLLKDDGIVAYPTETFYGIGARYDSEKALKRIVSIKKRPEEKAFPLIVGSIEALALVVKSINDIERALIEEFWPGPLTILFEAKAGLLPLICLHGKVAVRLTGNKVAMDLSITLGCPISSTSANVSSMPPARDAPTVHAYFRDGVDLIIDGGTTEGGLPSTIVSVKGGMIEIVRNGPIDLRGFCKDKGLMIGYNVGHLT